MEKTEGAESTFQLFHSEATNISNFLKVQYQGHLFHEVNVIYYDYQLFVCCLTCVSKIPKKNK